MQRVTLVFEMAKYIAGCINKRCETRPSTSHDAPNQSKQQQGQNAVAKAVMPRHSVATCETCGEQTEHAKG